MNPMDMIGNNLQANQQKGLVIMRLFIGWHFLYEGVIKLFNPNWTSKFYLLSAEGFTKPLFTWLASDGVVGVIDMLNVLALVIVGLSLILGLSERVGAIIGIGLLILYYCAHPAFPGLEQAGTEGSYFLINKNLIEAAALYVIYLCPTGHYFGLRGLLNRRSLGATNV